MNFVFFALTFLSASRCSAFPRDTSRMKREITCLEVGSTATASWINKAGEICTWTGVVGSNFGINPRNNARYDCNGRCGAGCNGPVPGTVIASLTPYVEAQDVYTQDCFSHDICSWFYGAEGGPSDPNCGQAYLAAVGDTVAGYTCGAQNPSYDVNPPGGGAVCVGSEVMVDVDTHTDTATGKT